MWVEGGHVLQYLNSLKMNKGLPANFTMHGLDSNLPGHPKRQHTHQHTLLPFCSASAMQHADALQSCLHCWSRLVNHPPVGAGAGGEPRRHEQVAQSAALSLCCAGASPTNQQLE